MTNEKEQGIIDMMRFALSHDFILQEPEPKGKKIILQFVCPCCDSKLWCEIGTATANK